MAMAELRANFLEFIRSDLEGPRTGEDEFLPAARPPQSLYSLGVLFPRVISESDFDAEAVEEDLGTRVAADKEEADDAPLAPMLQRRPASAGMTFAIDPDGSCEVRTRAATYLPDERNETRGWTRKALPEDLMTIGADNWKEFDGRPVLSGRGLLRIRWRSLDGCDVVTLSIVNAADPIAADAQPEPNECLFQLAVEVACLNAPFTPPPTPSFVVDDEEAELRLRYRRKIAWATGHGCSVEWDQGPDGFPSRIRMNFLPVALVPRFLPDARPDAQFDQEVLGIERLASVKNESELAGLLEPFVDDFEDWLGDLRNEVVLEHTAAFDRVIGRLDEQAKRLRHGLDFLSSGDSRVLKAFRLANTAILDQMERIAVVNGRKFDRSNARWRPFQLAFQLLAIPGAIGSEPEDAREVVDLIWFPTGGGKTEAYLFLMAFVIIHRRLVDPVSGGGTAVFSRYTLRLLTQDQFTRTAALVCCLDVMRRDGLIPGEKISIGLWIGGGRNAAPNKFKDALALAEKALKEEEPHNPFLMERCPLCGTAILPTKLSEDRSAYGFEASASKFLFRCPNGNCRFHDHLPIQIVDEALYEDPPTVLLGTIDKFARIAWDDRCRSFFGLNDKVPEHRPPDLVIQDELHLISGPLGSIAAIYESAIDTILARSGMRPKYIAATATIRGAADQTRRLYGRDVCVFPSPGTDSSDSYYMREDPDSSRARAYVGYMGQGHTPVTTTIHVLASALNAGGRVTPEDDYWTLVAYHNSRRELGKTMTFARDDVPLRMEVIADDNDVVRACDEVLELSSNVPTNQLPGVLDRMRMSRGTGDAIDVVACTSMISVGVDVSRLNLMVVMGQPKTAAEYIQATSRVGRGGDAAGLVVVNLAGTKPRDRAHYESFTAFHQGYYRWVEPTSVTPESPGACDRALHAAVVAAARLVDLPMNPKAAGFDLDEPDIAKTVETLRLRLESAVPARAWPDLESRFDSILEWWTDAAGRANLRYDAKAGRQFPSLLERYGENRGGPSKPTLDSMRNVEGDARFSVIGGSRKKTP